MTDYKPQKGDRVRVVLEGGEVRRSVEDDSWVIEFDDNTYITEVNDGAPFLVSIEKIEPPVVTFKPGDVVRSKRNPKWLYTIGQRGYTQHTDGAYFADGPRACEDVFTSADYELVSLG